MFTDLLKFLGINFHKKNDLSKCYVGIILFCVAFVFGPFRQLDFFANMPGDMIDPRLNNYFLENIYLFIVGKSSSLVHLGFFYPFPFVLGFSDNLFGACAPYLVSRFIGSTPEGAFQFWFVCGFFINFIASFIAIRMFGPSPFSCAVGALIFTFGLPATAQMGHAQLQYRFGTPLTIAFFYRFLAVNDWRSFIISFFWLVWQFFCSIYLGFFVSLLLGSMFLVLKIVPAVRAGVSMEVAPNSVTIRGLYDSFRTQHTYQKLNIIIIFFLLLLSLAVLFYPYFNVTRLYHFSRAWVEVSAMLPRISSYFIADHSLIWGFVSEHIKDVPIRWEQQLFIGFVPIAIIILGIIIGRKSIVSLRYLSGLFFSLSALVLITLNFNDYSLWKFFIALPLFSAIRAVSRIILIFMFPLSLFLAASTDLILHRLHFLKKKLFLLVCLALVIEVCAVKVTTTSKQDWQLRRHRETLRLPADLPNNSILFFAQKGGSFEGDELDAMFVAQKENLPTLNGYSGALPHHFRAEYSDDCAEYPRRILLYLDFMGRFADVESYRELARRVTPIGFVGCEESWRLHPPMTMSNRALTHEELSDLSLELSPKETNVEPGYLKIRIVNHGKQGVSALSSLDTPVRLAWRLIKSNAEPLAHSNEAARNLSRSCFLTTRRRDLPGDIVSGGFIDLLVPLPPMPACEGYDFEFTIVQRATIWGFAFDDEENIWAGSAVTPLRVALSSD